jgi:hypothetical protein
MLPEPSAAAWDWQPAGLAAEWTVNLISQIGISTQRAL